jgi:hypothetical protein
VTAVLADLTQGEDWADGWAADMWGKFIEIIYKITIYDKEK